MAKKSILDDVEVAKPAKSKKSKTVVSSMTSSGDMEMTNIAMRLTQGEIKEIQRVVNDMSSITRKANRSTLLRACFQLLKDAKKEKLLAAIKDLP